MRELESLDDVLAYLDRHGGLSRAYVQGVDLTSVGGILATADVRQALFLGCAFDPDTEDDLPRRGALVFPRLPDLPFAPYRPTLYTAAELYAGLPHGYSRTRDARVYHWWRHIGRRRDLASELAMTLHDHAISDALGDVAPADAVGVMGGHQLARDSRQYADAARLGHRLVAAGHAVLTGGGPGAMEAANLGAALAGSESDVAAAVASLAAHPTFTPDTDAWARSAFSVRERWPFDGPSLGVPTWFYGHEPANVFATRIAKFFSNAIREDTLLRLASRGLVCLPGAAGTVQEIFQAMTPRYYADRDPIPPLILVGDAYWTAEIPAWPLVAALADGRPMAGCVHLVASMDDVPGLLATMAP